MTGDTATHWVDLLAAREPKQPPRASGVLNRWQAFATLWRQEWHPPMREDRRVRWFAAAVSALVHVLFGIAALWLMLTQWLPPEPAAPEGEDIIQVEYVGIAARPDVGGGEPQPADAAAQATPSPATSQPAPASEARIVSQALPARIAAPQLETTVPDLAQREVPTPTTPNEQPLVVSAPAPDPTQAFVLPPTTARMETRTASPQLEARTPDVRVVDVPMPARLPQARIAPTAVASPTLAVREAQVAQRDIPTPLVAPTPRTRPTVDVAPRALPSEAPRVATRSIPTPASASTPAPPATAAAVAATSTSAQASALPAASPRPGASTPATRTGASPGAGPRTTPATGAWPSPDRGDDFDQATRNTPGGTRGAPGGLYNPDGSVRLADRPGSASSGLPPGSLVQEIDNLDRAGTWLRRRPADYQGTRFDEAWRPNETLLAEWVRKSVTTVRIPIPGTKKTIVCKTVLLAMGGGCDVSDPDLNDQPARARPPPDILFKPHLQEDNGAVKPAG